MASTDNATCNHKRIGRLPKETQKGKHPLFDEYWEKHQKLVYWWARKIGWYLRIPSQELISSIVLHFNRCLYSYDDTKCKWSTWLNQSLLAEIFRTFLRYESEWRAVEWFANHSNTKEKQEVHLTYAQHEIHNVFFRIPEKDDPWVDTILDNFQTFGEAWEFLSRGLEKRQRFVIEEHYLNKTTLRELGERLGITRERVRQIKEQALARIHRRVAMVDTFANLFKEEGE